MKQALFLLLALIVAPLGVVPVQARQSDEQPLTIQYLGISCVLITAPDGTQIVTDPFSGAPYPFPDGVEADVVTVSHSHPDHTNVRHVGGDPVDIRDLEPQHIGMVQITGYPAEHGGQYTGPVNIYVFQIGDVKIVHLGAPKIATLAPGVLEAIQDADVVLVPMLSISLDEAFPFLEQIGARTIIPMHYSESADSRFYGAATLEEFLAVVPSDIPVVADQASLTVTPGMPTQVVTMTRYEPILLRVRYLGHASFLLTAYDGTRLVIDPYSGISYDFPADLEANAVVVTHSHNDHNNTSAVAGDPVVISDIAEQEIGPFTITGYPTEHGKYNGTSMGANNVFVFEIGPIKLVHLGDTAPIDDPAVLEALQDADVALVAICSACLQLDEVLPQMEALSAHTLIPMEYSLSEEDRYYGAPTAGEFLATLPAALTVIQDVQELEVVPDMPSQVVTMTPLE